MNLRANRMSAEEASEIAGWTYEAPYEFYNNEPSPAMIRELMSEPYFTVYDAAAGPVPVGFFCSGNAAQVPNDAYPYSADYVDIGIDMRPDLTGKGNGGPFLAFVLEQIGQSFGERPFRLTVARFNQRAIRLYERFGFSRRHEFVKGSTTFIVMVRP
ncbi:GNAT family N-acetyltransferase [Paenibacillus lycopersici]|uniref:GNAT family N-acetyltransferase n=1 Tax=Paenibacillus lycopersici TaxID=2704462 RepID=A0A6C0G5W6_9BACL|nr:GNAT family protein [Paenibacillus lycopersici]QHT63114.1 GNAT family N-acetyltransferase [Paenibacillus lycopersici]